MKTFRFSFIGRQARAIGITYQIADTYVAENLGQALYMLNTDYDSIRSLKAYQNGKLIDSETVRETALIACVVPKRETDPKTGSYRYRRSDTINK